MALASLRYRKDGDGTNTYDIKHGSYMFDGSASDFHEWQFRVQMKLAATEDKDRASVSAKIVDGLSGDAFAIAMDIGSTQILNKGGIGVPIATLQERIFPMKEAEARELFRQGQKPGGPLSRATGESMLQYIARRKRWWKLLREMDSSIQMSNTLLGGMLLDLSGLTHMEENLVLTSTCNDMAFDTIAKTLLDQHWDSHNHPRSGGHRDGDDRPPRPGKWGGKGSGHYSYPKAYIATGGEAEEEDAYYEEEDYQDYQDQYEEYEGYGGHDDDDDDSEYVQLRTIEHLAADQIELDQSAADVAQAETVALMAWGRVKGKGKGKGKGKSKRSSPFKGSSPKGSYSGGNFGQKGKSKELDRPSLDERRRKLAELKSRTSCQACGQRAHWAGDEGCPKGKREQQMG